MLRPAGTPGLHLATITTPSSAAGNVDPLLDDGPADLEIAYAMTAGGFDVLANGDHLSAWGVSPATLREAAFRNLEAWAAGASWSIDAAGRRRVISSDTGDGWDASRILLPDAIAHLEGELAARATACSSACRRATSSSRPPSTGTTRSSPPLRGLRPGVRRRLRRVDRPPPLRAARGPDHALRGNRTGLIPCGSLRRTANVTVRDKWRVGAPHPAEGTVAARTFVRLGF